MAEGGDGSKNPFSFKKFVPQKIVSSESDESDPEPIDSTNVMDLLNDAPRQHQEKDDTDRRKRNDDGNPFSFKKFLQTDVKRSTSSHGSLSTFDLANDLPDFVQDHYTGDRTRSSIPDAPLPDFTLGLHNDSNVIPGVSPDTSFSDDELDQAPNLAAGVPHGISSPERALIAGDNGFPLDVDLNGGDDGLLLHGRHVTGGLPDFLSDTSAVGAGAISKHSPLENGFNSFLTSNGSNHDNVVEELRVEIARLREENQLLRNQLDQARQTAEREANRVERVHSEMVEAHRKEAEETSALENMVQQVEANLQASMKRAQKAESTITKLKQEITSLKGEVYTLKAEKQTLQAGGISEVIRDKTKYASEQLAVTAKAAEANLKQMLKGVETLKLMSDILASVESISEVKDEASASASDSTSPSHDPPS